MQENAQSFAKATHDHARFMQDNARPFVRPMHENVRKTCTHMHDLTQVSCMNLAKIHSMIMQDFFAWVELDSK